MVEPFLPEIPKLICDEKIKETINIDTSGNRGTVNFKITNKKNTMVSVVAILIVAVIFYLIMFYPNQPRPTGNYDILAALTTGNAQWDRALLESLPLFSSDNVFIEENVFENTKTAVEAARGKGKKLFLFSLSLAKDPPVGNIKGDGYRVTLKLDVFDPASSGKLIKSLQKKHPGIVVIPQRVAPVIPIRDAVQKIISELRQ